MSENESGSSADEPKPSTTNTEADEEVFKKPQFKPPEAKPAKHSEELPPRQQSKPVFSYEEPSWSAPPPPDKKYHFEIIKGGTVLEPIQLSGQSFYTIGRLPECHISLQHPSLSRYHAILQYCDSNKGRDPNLRDGWYLMDLGSANSTVVNKQKLEPNQYKRLDVGHVIKFGTSTRIFVLQGIQDEEEVAEQQPPSKMASSSVSQKPRKIAKPRVLAAPKQSDTQANADEGCMWGIGMDDEAVYKSADMDPNFENSDSSSEDSDGERKKKERKPLDLSDPKKTLRVFFEREDLGLPEYQVENIGKNRHRAFIEIAVHGRAMRVEGEGGNKKEAVAECAREACITLDKMDLLRPRNRNARRKEVKKDWAANDYYDSDEDSFFDRTGELERKRKHRMAREKRGGTKSGGSSGPVHTEKSLKEGLETLEKEIGDITSQLEEDEKKRAAFQAARQKAGATSELDDLDAYMLALKQGVAMDATTRVKLKHRLMEAQKERQRFQRLLSIAKGPSLPASLLVNALASKQLETPQVEKAETATSTVPSVGKLPKSLPPLKIKSNLPTLDAFKDDDEDDNFGVGKAKMKKLEDHLIEDASPESAPMEATQQDESEKPSDEPEPAEDSGKVYGVFLPPELRQSLDEHADEVDKIWDVNRGSELATMQSDINENVEKNTESTT